MVLKVGACNHGFVHRRDLFRPLGGQVVSGVSPGWQASPEGSIHREQYGTSSEV